MTIDERIAKVRTAIDDSCRQAGRNPAEVTLIAVTKGVPVERIGDAYSLGLRDFGESKLQEATPKIASLPEDIVWHFIGRLQSNKARRAAATFDFIHTLESKSQLDEIGRQDRIVDGAIQINVASEEQKSGISPSGLDEFVLACLNCSRVRLRGLMTIGPMLGPSKMRPYFRELREMLAKVPGGDVLSMGMSGDFVEAIQEGATHIRVGSAIFGDRA
ncbi:MAG TPA: YggS family pyridoxal phosphate-dependent enzyme [Fimbriimonadaceae bacterium]|nr:YggS family pyridoxal phosphate-dependent enzyme [Fimbriimonadaceae bacterium]HRJ95714.1 YggS family pyridoxal phosphate-dependent enzyme [Fimbriimonadaceae bacterium]